MQVTCVDGQVFNNRFLDEKFLMLKNGPDTYVAFLNISKPELICAYSNRAGKHNLNVEYDENSEILTCRIPDREAINRYYEGLSKPKEGKNRMGCSESWYDPYYAITQTFTKDHIDMIEDEDLLDLVKLAENIQSALY